MPRDKKRQNINSINQDRHENDEEFFQQLLEAADQYVKEQHKKSEDSYSIYTGKDSFNLNNNDFINSISPKPTSLIRSQSLDSFQENLNITEEKKPLTKLEEEPGTVINQQNTEKFTKESSNPKTNQHNTR